MFPKIVRSAALAERTDVLAQALGATALLGAAAALFFTIFPRLPLQIAYAPSYLVVAPLLPWFAWCMLPLTLANVLVNNLLAREKFGLVPWLVILTVAYTITLWIVANRSLAQRLSSGFEMSSRFSAVSVLCFWRWRFISRGEKSNRGLEGALQSPW